MLNCLYTVSLSIALGAGPGGYGVPQYTAGPTYYGGAAPVGMHGGSFGGGGFANAPSSPAFGSGVGDQLYPYDSHWPWMHGYFQEIPAYGGFGAFRPYNYKHVLAQSQAAAGWGLHPQRPYSQQFWHRYQAAASMAPAMHAPESHGPYTPIQPIQPSQYQNYQLNYQPGYQPMHAPVVPMTGYSPTALPQTRPAPPKHSAEMMRQRIAEESRRLNLKDVE